MNVSPTRTTRSPSFHSNRGGSAALADRLSAEIPRIHVRVRVTAGLRIESVALYGGNRPGRLSAYSIGFWGGLLPNVAVRSRGVEAEAPTADTTGTARHPRRPVRSYSGSDTMARHERHARDGREAPALREPRPDGRDGRPACRRAQPHRRGRP